MVTIGHAGNMADAHGRGAVAYDYKIGVHEVTNAQNAAFLNAVARSDPHGLWNASMSSSALGGIHRTGAAGAYSYTVKSGRGNQPVLFVSFWDAARFSNWMHNGQGSGSTETGAYALNGISNPAASAGIRLEGATFFLPTSDEWHKAAYHDPSRAAGSFWNYPTRSDEMPTSCNMVYAHLLLNMGNFYRDDGHLYSHVNKGYALTQQKSFSTTTNYLSTVGSYSLASSIHGTFDQGGNAAEWTEPSVAGAQFLVRGGSWADTHARLLASATFAQLPGAELNTTGFRLAAFVPAAVPEPSLLSSLFGACALVFSAGCRWRTSRHQAAKGSFLRRTSLGCMP